MNAIYLTSDQCRDHFMLLGAIGIGRHGIPGLSGITNPAAEIPQAQTCWDAISDAIIALSDITSVRLTREQMRGVLERSGLMAKVIEFGEVETQIQGNLASFLSLDLIGESWPTYGDIRHGRIDFAHFTARAHASARHAGYEVEAPSEDPQCHN